MGKVEILINEEGVLRIVHHNDLRAVLERLRPESSELPRAAAQGNCRSAPGQEEEVREEEEERDREERFNRAMRICFLIAVAWTVISVIFYEHISVFYAQIHWKEIVLMVLIAPVVPVSMFALSMSGGPPSARRREVQTISSLVQEV